MTLCYDVDSAIKKEQYKWRCSDMRAAPFNRLLASFAATAVSRGSKGKSDCFVTVLRCWSESQE